MSPELTTILIAVIPAMLGEQRLAIAALAKRVTGVEECQARQETFNRAHDHEATRATEPEVPAIQDVPRGPSRYVRAAKRVGVVVLLWAGVVFAMHAFTGCAPRVVVPTPAFSDTLAPSSDAAALAPPAAARAPHVDPGVQGLAPQLRWLVVCGIVVGTLALAAGAFFGACAPLAWLSKPSYAAAGALYGGALASLFFAQLLPWLPWLVGAGVLGGLGALAIYLWHRFGRPGSREYLVSKGYAP